MTNQIHKEIISKLIDYAFADIAMRVYVTKTPKASYFTVAIAPFAEPGIPPDHNHGYLRFSKIDATKILTIRSKTTPFLGTKEMRARELIPIINKMLQGEDNESAEDIH